MNRSLVLQSSGNCKWVKAGEWERQKCAYGSGDEDDHYHHEEAITIKSFCHAYGTVYKISTIQIWNGTWSYESPSSSRRELPKLK
jgi:hypothetical protein